MSSEQAKRGECGGQHAVVIGASMAGLLGGRVLSDHFERVFHRDGMSMDY